MTDRKKVVLCVPTMTRPYKVTCDSIAASVPLLDEAGIDHFMVTEVGCPYISAARATMLRKALDIKADIIVFIDHDLSWEPKDLLKLIQTEGDVVAGTYRFKTDEVRYMGVLDDNQDGSQKVRHDGAIKATLIPAGFLKITKEAVSKFMKAYPHLAYGEVYSPSIDLFNHGAHKGFWYGEDYSFSRNWIDAGGDIWLVPDLNVNHHTTEKEYKGNFHEFLLSQPGGSKFNG